MISIVSNEPIYAGDKTVAEIVSHNINTAHVFKKHGIDFCCGGGIAVQEVCLKKGIDFAKLMTELENVGRTIDTEHDFNNWDLTKLIKHIVDMHHAYVKENRPILIQYADKVVRVHGHHYTELVEINDLVHHALE